eukprot:12397760-Alexandrium_andersonii.AAC.1
MGPGLKGDDSFGIRAARDELPQASATPPGPGLRIDESFGHRRARDELPRASANPGALKRGTPGRPGKSPP